MKKIAIIAMSLIITACATLPAGKQANNQKLSWQQRQAQLSPLTAWDIQGAVAIRQGRQGKSASLYLQQQQRHYNLQVFGPLGIGRHTLVGEPGNVTLTDSDGKTIHTNSPEALFQAELGWSLPISNLYFWLRGLPAPHLDKHIQFDQYHHILQLQQQGWVIDYRQYTAVDQYDLPSEITMRYGDLLVKIIISQWQLNNHN